MYVAGRSRSRAELDLAAYSSWVYHARGKTPTWASFTFLSSLLHWWLTRALIERPFRRTVIPPSTSTKAVEPKLPNRILMVKVSTQSTVDSTPSPVARSTVSRFGSGRGDRPLSQSMYYPIVRPSSRTTGVPPQPSSRLETTATMRSISTPTRSSSI